MQLPRGNSVMRRKVCLACVGGGSGSLHGQPCQGAERLLRFAPALRVTALPATAPLLTTRLQGSLLVGTIAFRKMGGGLNRDIFPDAATRGGGSRPRQVGHS